MATLSPVPWVFNKVTLSLRSFFVFGLQDVVEDLGKRPGIRQAWYLDCGNIHARVGAVGAAFAQLRDGLAKKGLVTNRAKCVIYAKTLTLYFSRLGGIPVLTNFGKMG